MKAMFLDKVAGPEALGYGDVPPPPPAVGKVLVKVFATAITPTELQWAPTWKQRSGEPRPFPLVLGHEFSGVVAALGAGVNDLKLGAEVYGTNDWFENGAQAAYCAASAETLAPKPKSLTHTQAAVVPISGLTAWQGLFDHAQLQAGERVLIHGAAGGVGVFAVQLAHWRGAHVMGTVSARNVELVHELGADEVIDYHRTPFESVAREMDVVFDTVGGATLDRSWGVLKPGGRLVTIATQSEDSADPRVREAFFVVAPQRAQLSELARLIDSHVLRPVVEAVFPLAQAQQAYARAQQGHLRGKIALQVVADLLKPQSRQPPGPSAFREAA
jgi:NADPH:quinone reductase-like Zn-dependent oxidoreductase